jgi:serine/threonine protein phosphatase PrpC
MDEKRKISIAEEEIEEIMEIGDFENSPDINNVKNNSNKIINDLNGAKNSNLHNLNNKISNNINPVIQSKNLTNMQNISKSNTNQSNIPNIQVMQISKPQQSQNNNINNIFSAFSNSSLIGGVNYKQSHFTGNNQINNNSNNPSNFGSSPSGNSKKAEILNIISNHSQKNNQNNQNIIQTKDRKNSPLKFNALFGNSSLLNSNHNLVNNNMNLNSGVSQSQKNNQNKSKNSSNNNLINISNSPRINKILQEATVKYQNSKISNMPLLSQNQPSLSNQPSNSITSTNSYSVIEYSYKEDQNPRFRNTMEDFCKIVDMYMGDRTRGYFSLYDGHGGTDPVKYAKERMPEILSKFLDKKESTESALISAFSKVDDELKFTDSENAGCTACVILITQENGKRFLYSANAGDTKSILLTQNEFIKLSVDHKCTDQSEVERIKQSGGLVFNGRVFGQLALTRALGDLALKKYGVSAMPHVTRVEITEKHKFAVVASDGIWDVNSEEDLLFMSKSFNNAEDFCNNLIKISLAKGSKDNMSCIVIKLN